MFLVVMEILFSEGQLNFSLKCEHRTKQRKYKVSF